FRSTPVFYHRVHRIRISAQRAGGKQRVIGRHNRFRSRRLANRTVLRSESVRLVSGEQLQTRKVVAGNQALNFVQQRLRIEWTELRFQIMRRQPYHVPIGFAGLGSATLAHIGTYAFAEGNELANVSTHAVGDTNDEFEIAANARQIPSLLEQL